MNIAKTGLLDGMLDSVWAGATFFGPTLLNDYLSCLMNFSIILPIVLVICSILILWERSLLRIMHVVVDSNRWSIWISSNRFADVFKSFTLKPSNQIPAKSKSI